MRALFVLSRTLADALLFGVVSWETRRALAWDVHVEMEKPPRYITERVFLCGSAATRRLDGEYASRASERDG